MSPAPPTPPPMIQFGADVLTEQDEVVPIWDNIPGGDSRLVSNPPSITHPQTGIW